MQYKVLLTVLMQMTDEQLEQDITVLDKNTDEYFPVGSIVKETETDVLDKGHVVLTINQ